jgi:DNA-binding MarR family transcriptional regulator
MEAISAVRFAAKRLHEAMETWTESYGLTESRLTILTSLYFNPEHQMPLGELASAQHLVPRTVTGLIDNLERDGLVRRVPDPSDRRSVRAQLTRAGLARMQVMSKDAAERQARGAGGLSSHSLLSSGTCAFCWCSSWIERTGTRWSCTSSRGSR